MSTTTKKPKLVVLDESPLIINYNKGVTKQTKIYKLGDEKFRIRYENSNGTPLGFNNKMCLSQYSKTDAKWNHLEDIKVLSVFVNEIPSYYSHKCESHMKQFFKEMEDRLVKVYS